MTDRWYVAATQPGREIVAEQHLGRQGFHTWTPHQIRTVSHARRRYDKRVPFFPGYMFVSLDVDRHRWRQVNSTLGVRSLVMVGERPLACPAGLVENLQSLADENGMFNAAASMKPGDAVRVVAGPFAELAGTLISIDSADRAKILLQMMRSDIAVTLNVGKLAPA